MPQPHRTHPRSFALAFFSAALFAVAAHAGDVIQRIEMGFGGFSKADHWSPVTVWLAPPKDPVGGVLLIQYEQDPTQSARHILPFALTPGSPTPVQAVVNFPRGCQAISFTLLDDRGKVIDSRVLRSAFTDADQTKDDMLTGVLSDEQRLAVSVGVPSLLRALPKPQDTVDLIPSPFNGWSGKYMGLTDLPADQLKNLRFQQLGAVKVEPAALPFSAAAFDGLECLVLDPHRAPITDRRVAAAIRAWVQSGGRLVLLTPDDGGEWSSLLSDGSTPLPAQAGPSSETPTPDEAKADLAQAFDTIDTNALTDSERGVTVINGQVVSPPATPKVAAPPRHIEAGHFHARDTLRARALTLTPQARAQGWSLRWSTGPDRGLIAHGPFGLGTLTIVGIDPESLLIEPDADANTLAWRAVLTAPLSDYLQHQISKTQFSSFASASSGTDPESRAALRVALDSLARVPPLSNAVFITIVACVGVLALLVGPVDAIWLKRANLRHRSWQTALGWTALASLAAYAVPQMLRSGPSVLRRLSVVDAVMTPAGPAAAAERTAVTGVFANAPERLTTQDPTPGSWWQGVSAVAQSTRFNGPSRPDPTRGLPPLETIQSDSAAPGRRQNFPGDIYVPQWNFRTFLDRGPASVPFSARATRSGQSVRVDLDNLAPARLEAAYIRLDDGWHPLVAKDDHYEPVLEANPPKDADGSTRAFMLDADDTISNGPHVPVLLSQFFSLSGTRARTLALDTYTAQGRGVLLALHLREPQSDASITPKRPGKDFVAVHNAVYRLALPLPPSPSAP